MLISFAQVTVVVHMVNASKSMRCFIKGAVVAHLYSFLVQARILMTLVIVVELQSLDFGQSLILVWL